MSTSAKSECFMSDTIHLNLPPAFAIDFPGATQEEIEIYARAVKEGDVNVRFKVQLDTANPTEVQMNTIFLVNKETTSDQLESILKEIVQKATCRPIAVWEAGKVNPQVVTGSFVETETCV